MILVEISKELLLSKVFTVFSHMLFVWSSYLPLYARICVVGNDSYHKNFDSEPLFFFSIIWKCRLDQLSITFAFGTDLSCVLEPLDLE